MTIDAKTWFPLNRIPLTIGVIGHRDLVQDQLGRIEDDIRRVIASYRGRFTSTPILLLTSLAEGADQLAMTECAHIEGVQTIAVLPFELAEYEKDFVSNEELDRFRLLLSQVSAVIVADDFLSGRQTRPRDIDIQSSDERDAAYQRCAQFVSDNSHLLIAVWDGLSRQLAGGTSDTIDYRLPSTYPLTDGRVRLWPTPCEEGILIRTVAGRRRNASAIGNVDDGRNLGTLRLISRDRTARNWDEAGNDSVASHINTLNEQIASSSEPCGDFPLVTEAVMEVADSDATQYQTRYWRIATSLLLSGIATLMLINVEQNFSARWIFAIAACSLLLTASLWWALSRLNTKDRFQQSRTLAEGARIQCVWLDADVAECPSDFYLNDLIDVSWIRRVLRSAWLVDRMSPPRSDNPTDVAYQWMSGQVKYFLGSLDREGAIARNRKKVHFYNRLATLGLIIAGLGLLPDAFRFVTGSALPVAVSGIAQASWELGLAIAAACAAYENLLAFREIDRQYTAIATTYQVGLRELEITRSAQLNSIRVRDLVTEVGREALRETSSWLAINHDRSVRPV